MDSIENPPKADLRRLAEGHLLFRKDKFVRLSPRRYGEQNVVPAESAAEFSEADSVDSTRIQADFGGLRWNENLAKITFILLSDRESINKMKEFL